MTNASPATPPSTRTSAPENEVVAEMIWTAPAGAPEVTLSFQGLHEPIVLWEDLRALGWIVPHCPPRPGSAIEWVPDPIAGTDYTVHPWRVNEFRLGEGPWSRDQAAAIGELTFDVLRRHHARISGSRTQILALAARPIDYRPTSHDASAQEWALFIDLDSAARAATEPGLTHCVGISGRMKDSVYWTELVAGAGQATIDAATFAAHSAQAWLVDGPRPPEVTSAARTMFQMVILGVSPDDSTVHKLEKFLGDTMTASSLRPLLPDTADAVLVTAAVATNAYEMLESNLRLRMPTAIIRTQV